MRPPRLPSPPALPTGANRRDFLHRSALAGLVVGLAPGWGPLAAAAEPAPTGQDAPGFDMAALAAVLDGAERIEALRSIVVMRSGVLVGERHLRGATEADLRPINSATKGVCALLVGQALQQGRLTSLAQTVDQLLPELAPRFPEAYARNISLQQILTGTTGLAYDFMTQFRQLGSAADPLAYVMGLPRDSQPAGTWSYNDAAISLLTPILERAQGLSLPELAQRDLFTPLGIDRFTWDRDKTGKHLAYAGLRLRTQDLAKIAGLVSHRGQWQAQQVLPAAWADDCTRSHGPTAWRVPPVAESGFGYLWFTGRLQGLPVAWAWGYGAQFALVAPTAGLAIATAATEPPPARLAAQNAAVMDLVSQVLALAAKPAASGDTRKI